ncbi:MAG: Non-specific serine/threonine protein kinase [Nocardia sp.]|uniref:serine/threonine-protein kinase n=1 Tax=Nocardia sp. TaxID=1821 RepID=UPI002620CFB9|nr:serine/threonine-protein kinase [Nocardia sp.]MCU1648488.1 Non-specific serine/threonine protein kinase [Nocardia sp.]
MSVRDLDDGDIARVRAALPGYDIGGQVGRGGCGVVLAGTHRGLHRRVAIKQIPPQFADDMQVRRRFVAEARVMATLDHPHVVPVYDYIEHEDLCLLVLEYLPGGTVENRFITAGFEATAAVAVALSCAAGLDAAHRHGILHRDVKPSNLMFAANGTLKLTDFGIAKIVGGDDTLVTRAGEIIGTPSYIAPEQVRGQQLSPSTDVYALATMLYQLLSGSLPFPPGEDALAMLFAHAYGEPVPLGRVAPAIPQPIADAVMRGLAPDPGERFDTAESFGIALAEPAAFCWGTNWLTPIGIPLIGADTIVAAATGGARPASRPFTPPPGSPPSPFTPAPSPQQFYDPRRTTAQSPGPVERTPNGPIPPGPAGDSGPETPLPPHYSRPGFGRGWRPTPNGPSRFDEANEPTLRRSPTPSGRPQGAASGGAGPMPRVRPLEPVQHSGIRLVDVDRGDLVPIQKVVTLRSPRVPFFAAAVLAVVVCGAAVLGVGAGPQRDLPPTGQIHLAGIDPSAASTVDLDLSKPVPLVLTGTDADTARLSLNLLGVRLGGAETPVQRGASTDLPAPVNPYVLAGDLTAELTLSRNGSDVTTYRFGVRTAQRATTTATAIVLLVLLLFAAAYAESNARTLRHGSARITATIGLTLSAALLALTALGASWILLGREPTLPAVILCAALGAAAGAAFALGCRRVGKRYRYVRVLRMRERA